MMTGHGRLCNRQITTRATIGVIKNRCMCATSSSPTEILSPLPEQTSLEIPAAVPIQRTRIPHRASCYKLTVQSGMLSTLQPALHFLCALPGRQGSGKCAVPVLECRCLKPAAADQTGGCGGDTMNWSQSGGCPYKTSPPAGGDAKNDFDVRRRQGTHAKRRGMTCSVRKRKSVHSIAARQRSTAGASHGKVYRSDFAGTALR